jgi:predicted GNAT family acetyltransferase
MESSHEVINNKDDRRFEISVDGYISIIPYILHNNEIALFRTQVAEELRGKGLAVKLVEHALNFAKENDLKILPYCPFIRKYINEHPEWKPRIKKFQVKDILLWLRFVFFN